MQIFRTTLNDSLSLNSDLNGNEFSSIVMIPFFKIKKEKNVWYVTLVVANQFYECNFPFQFKDYFLIWKSTHQFEVKVQILQLLAQMSNAEHNLVLRIILGVSAFLYAALLIQIYLDNASVLFICPFPSETRPPRHRNCESLLIQFLPFLLIDK